MIKIINRKIKYNVIIILDIIKYSDSVVINTMLTISQISLYEFYLNRSCILQGKPTCENNKNS